MRDTVEVKYRKVNIVSISLRFVDV